MANNRWKQIETQWENKWKYKKIPKKYKQNRASHRNYTDKIIETEQNIKHGNNATNRQKRIQ